MTIVTTHNVKFLEFPTTNPERPIRFEVHWKMADEGGREFTGTIQECFAEFDKWFPGKNMQRVNSVNGFMFWEVIDQPVFVVDPACELFVMEGGESG